MTRVTLACAAAMLVLVSGCGDSGDAKATTEATTEPEPSTEARQGPLAVDQTSLYLAPSTSSYPASPVKIRTRGAR